MFIEEDSYIWGNSVGMICVNRWQLINLSHFMDNNMSLTEFEKADSSSS